MSANFLLCVSLVLLATAVVQGETIPSGADAELPFFNITIRLVDESYYNVPVIESVFETLFGTSCTMTTLYWVLGSTTSNALFQFAQTNKMANSDSLKQKLLDNDLPALVVEFSYRDIHLIDLSWGMPISTGTGSPSSTGAPSGGSGAADSKSAPSWVAEYPGLVAVFVGMFVIVVVFALVVIHRVRANRQKTMRDTLLGDEASTLDERSGPVRARR